MLQSGGMGTPRLRHSAMYNVSVCGSIVPVLVLVPVAGPSALTISKINVLDFNDAPAPLVATTRTKPRMDTAPLPGALPQPICATGVVTTLICTGVIGEGGWLMDGNAKGAFSVTPIVGLLGPK